MYFLEDERTIIRDSYDLGRAIGQVYYFLLISSYFSQDIDTIGPAQLDPNTGQIKKTYISQTGEVITVNM